MIRPLLGSAVIGLVVGSLLAAHFTDSYTQAALHRLRRQTSNKKPLKGGVCVLPQPLKNGKYRPSEKRCPEGDTTPACLMLPGAFVPEDWVLYYDCDRGYIQDGTQSVAICFNNTWRPYLPVCNKYCPPLRSQSLDLKCEFGGNKVSCDKNLRPGTVANQTCKEYYNPAYEFESSQLTCLNTGVWNYPLSYCTPDDICKQDGDTVWVCKKISECPRAQEDLTKRIIPENCYVSNKERYICCEPETDNRLATSKPQPEERKSIQMCKKYAEAVYVTLPNPDGDGEQKIDSCALAEPVEAPVPEGVLLDIPPEHPSKAQPREFPHIAVIGYGEHSYKRPALRCVGSLISDRYVLSLVTCSDTFIGPAEWVRLGDYNVNSNKDDEEGDSLSVTYDIVERIHHPDFKKASHPNDIFYHDIALFKLNASVKFDEYIRPICLHNSDRFANNYALTTGWGPVELGERPSDILQKINLTIVGNKECSAAYKFFGEEKDGLNTDRVMCASLLDGRSTCMGLEGSPLQIRLRDPYCMYSLAGLYYFGRACFVQSPAVYIRVSHYLEWIENIVWP